MVTTQTLIETLRSSHKAHKEVVEDIINSGGIYNRGHYLTLRTDPEWFDLAQSVERTYQAAKEIEAQLHAAGHPLPPDQLCPNPRVE